MTSVLTTLAAASLLVPAAPVITALATTLATRASTTNPESECTILCVCQIPSRCPLPTPLKYTKATTITVTATPSTHALNLRLDPTPSSSLNCGCNKPPSWYTGDPAACSSAIVPLCNMPPIVTEFTTVTITIEPTVTG